MYFEGKLHILLLFLTNKKVIFGSNFNSTVLTKGVAIFVRFLHNGVVIV